jgi:hypothetical protein
MSDNIWGLDKDVQRKILESRLVKLAQAGYQHELNYRFLESHGQEDVKVKHKDLMNETLIALEFHKEELKKLDVE